MQGSYVLQQLMQPFEHHSFGLYRDDAVAIKKKIIEIFKDCGLKFTIKTNVCIKTLTMQKHF